MSVDSSVSAENPKQAQELRCSVIIPVYNGAGEIGRALRALERQIAPLTAFEVIVVDDGSTDDTAQTVEAWGRSHPALNLRVVRQANAGPASARNHGARMAHSDLLLYTDADCIPQPGWVQAFLDTFATPSPPAAAMGSYLSSQPEPAARFSQLEFEERYALMEARGGNIDMVATYSAAYRRTVFLESGGFDERFPKANNEDAEFSYRLSMAGYDMRFVRAAQVEHEHDATWASYFRTKMGRGFWRTIVYRRYPEKAIRDTYTPNVLKAQLPLSALGLFGFVLTLLTRRMRCLLLAAPFLASTAPMTAFAARHAPDVAPWVPWGALVRALAFVVGVARAMLTGEEALRPAQTGRTTWQPQPMAREESSAAQPEVIA